MTEEEVVVIEVEVAVEEVVAVGAAAEAVTEVEAAIVEEVAVIEIVVVEEKAKIIETGMAEIENVLPMVNRFGQNLAVKDLAMVLIGALVEVLGMDLVEVIVPVDLLTQGINF